MSKLPSISCSRIAGAIDPDLGRRYFEAAIEAAADIDQEAVGLLKLLATLAERTRKDNAEFCDIELAKHFATMLETCHRYLGDWEGFPWISGIRGIAALHPAVAALAVCRWDHRGTIHFSTYAATLADIYQELHFVDPASAVAWLLMSELGSNNALAVSLKAIASTSKALYIGTALTFISDYVTRTARLDSRAMLCRNVIEWAQVNRLHHRRELRDVFAVHRFLHPAMDADAICITRCGDTARNAPKTTTVHASEEESISENLGRLQFLTKEAIEAELLRISDVSIADFDRWTERQREIPVFLHKIMSLPLPSEYIRQLDGLMAVDSELLSSYDLFDALQERQSAWGYHASVREWMAKLPERLASERFMAFIDDEHLSHYRLDNLNEAFGIQQDRMLRCLVDVLPSHIRELPATVLYDIAMASVYHLEPGVALSTLQWALPDLVGRMRLLGRIYLECRNLTYPHPVTSLKPPFFGISLAIQTNRFDGRLSIQRDNLCVLGTHHFSNRLPNGSSKVLTIHSHPRMQCSTGLQHANGVLY